MQVNKIQERIEKKEEEIKELKEKMKEESDEMEWVYIPELKIEVQTKIHDKNKTLSAAMQTLKKGESVITYGQVQWLRNSKYRDQLNLSDTWEFVYPNPDKISSDNGYVAWFVASSDFADLDCYGYSVISYSTLGVRFVRKKNSKRSEK